MTEFHVGDRFRWLNRHDGKWHTGTVVKRSPYLVDCGRLMTVTWDEDGQEGSVWEEDMRPVKKEANE